MRTVWRKTIALIKEKGGSVPFEVVKALAVRFASAPFGLSWRPQTYRSL